MAEKSHGVMLSNKRNQLIQVFFQVLHTFFTNHKTQLRLYFTILAFLKIYLK